MTEKKGDDYYPNPGQTYVPPTSNINVPRAAWIPTPRPNPPLPPLEFRPQWKQEGWSILLDLQHELHGVTPQMIDWFWANMEKGYFLWAPGDHKWFEWIDPPCKVGFVGSSHIVTEQTYPGGPVMPLTGIPNERKDMSWHPFTSALGHVIVEYVGTGTKACIHQWESAHYGSVHRITLIKKGELLDVDEKLRTLGAEHGDYEEARWCEFLPQLYNLWKDHPDPSQNVRCDLRVKKLPNGEWAYVSENKPVIK
jgi:hypothetical protein